MPTSGWQHLNFVFNHMTPGCGNTRRSILDIGMGGGKWGVLIREFLEYRANRYWPTQWIHQVHGVEAWEKYRNPMWDYCYNNVLIGDISQLIGEINKRPNYDFILLLDILEHFEKDIGIKILDAMVKNTKELVFCCFPDAKNPKKALRQGAVHGNPFETHRSLWSVKEDFKKYKVIIENDNLCAVYGEA